MDIWPELFVSGLPDRVLAMTSLEPRELGSAIALERSGDLGWLESELGDDARGSRATFGGALR